MSSWVLTHRGHKHQAASIGTSHTPITMYPNREVTTFLRLPLPIWLLNKDSYFSHGTITDDSDIWVFGGKTVYKNFFEREKYCETFSVAEIAKHFGLTREKMILLAMLTGSDYTEGIENVGPVTGIGFSCYIIARNKLQPNTKILFLNSHGNPVRV